MVTVQEATKHARITIANITATTILTVTTATDTNFYTFKIKKTKHKFENCQNSEQFRTLELLFAIL